jgi:type I restriction enzyme S subunit
MSDIHVPLPIGWNNRLLADLGEWSGGQTPLKANPLYWQEGNVLWVSPKDITGPLIADSEDKITSLGLANTRLHLYPVTSIMVVVRSGILRHRFPVTRCTKPFTVNQDLKVLIPHDDVDPQFIFCMLNQLGPTILSRVVKAGTTVESVDIPVFLSLSIPTPPPPEQRKIARILTTVDNLIEKTEALIAKYQAIKQGMMHDLFTRGVDEHGHLRPPYEQAPELYKQSELGWIPREWEVCRVGDRLERIEQGWSPDCESEPASTGEWGVLKTTAVVWEGFAGYENKRLPKHLLPLPQYEVHVDDVLMTRGGPNSRVGVVAHVRETTDKLMLSDKIYRLVPKKGLLPNYFALALSSERTQTHLSTLKTGLAESQTNISQEIVRRLWIGLPKPDEQRKTCERLEGVHQIMRAELNDLAKLRLQKTGLMQDLLTGNVRVNADESEEVSHA